jgi:hypothetical protein
MGRQPRALCRGCCADRVGLFGLGGELGTALIEVLYRPSYYTASVLDRDGNNIEAVCHAA